MKATFTKVNDMTLTATVPTGAKTGKISVTTPRWNCNNCYEFHSDCVVL